MRIMVLNGPNLNLLGSRETDVYGSKTLHDIEGDLQSRFEQVELVFRQSNHEGGLVDAIHEAEADSYTGVVLNAAAYTHTSVAVRDAVAAVSVPVIEVHISNVYQRESFRRRSLLSPVCAGLITGLGTDVYRLAILHFIEVNQG
jgi:3-dehydroquinate dehydratase-2